MTDEKRIYMVKVQAGVETTVTVVANNDEEAIDKAEEVLMDELRNEGSDCINGDIECVFCKNIHPLDLDDLSIQLHEGEEDSTDATLKKKAHLALESAAVTLEDLKKSVTNKKESERILKSLETLADFFESYLSDDVEEWDK